MNNMYLDTDILDAVKHDLNILPINLKDIDSTISIQEQKLSSLPSGMIQSTVDENNNLIYSVAPKDDPVWKNNPNYDRDAVQYGIYYLSELRNIQKSNK